MLDSRVPGLTATGVTSGDMLKGVRFFKGGDVPERWWALFKSPALKSFVSATLDCK